MTLPPGRPKGFAPNSPEQSAARRRPRRNFAAAPLQLGDANLRHLLPMTHPTGTDPPVPDIYDQGPTSSCVENAIAQGVRCLCIREGLPVVTLSRLGLYFDARAESGDQPLDDGTQPAAALDAIQTIGMGDESTWPFDPAQVLVPPPPAYYRSAFDSMGALRTAAITDVPGQRQNEIRDALNRGCPVTLGLYIDEHFEKGLDAVWEPGAAPVLGGHYVLGLQSDARGLYCVSSWGANFAEMGGQWVSWRAIEDITTTVDLYALEGVVKAPGT